MPIVTVGVEIEGEELPESVRVQELHVGMALDAHHDAQIDLAASDHHDRDTIRSADLDDVFGKIGKQIRIVLDPVEAGEQVVFEGFVSRVDHSRQRDGDHRLSIVATSPTGLLDAGERCRIWEQKSVKDIVGAVLAPYGLLQSDIQKLPAAKLPYEAQFEETDWAFVRRLAARCGYWLYFDGQQLLAVDSFGGSPLEIGVSGSGAKARFESLSFSARVLPGAFLETSILAESKKDASHDDAEGDSIQSSHDFVKLARERSGELYTVKSHPRRLGEVHGEAEQKDHARARAQGWLGGLVTASGWTTYPGMLPGKLVDVKGTGGKEDARYVVTKASHAYFGAGGYRCGIELCPAAAAFPLPQSVPRSTALQRAVVVKRYDAAAPGMIKVRYSRALDGSTAEGDASDGQAITTWVRVASPHAGEGGGLLALPEEGDEVLVGHVGGRATQPVVLGAMYTKEKKSKVFDDVAGLNEGDKNEGKAWRTKSGNLVLLRDTPGKETIELRSPDGKNVVRMTLDGGAQVAIETEGVVHVKAKKDVVISAEGKMTFESTGDMKLSSRGNVEIKAQQSLKAEAATALELKGLQLKAEGQTTAEMSAVKVDVKGQALTSIQGALVKIN